MIEHDPKKKKGKRSEVKKETSHRNDGREELCIKKRCKVEKRKRHMVMGGKTETWCGR